MPKKIYDGQNSKLLNTDRIQGEFAQPRLTCFHPNPSLARALKHCLKFAAKVSALLTSPRSVPEN